MKKTRPTALLWGSLAAAMLSMALLAGAAPATAAPRSGPCAEACTSERETLRSIRQETRAAHHALRALYQEARGLPRGDERRKEIRREAREIKKSLRALHQQRRRAKAALRSCRQECRASS